MPENMEYPKTINVDQRSDDWVLDIRDENGDAICGITPANKIVAAELCRRYNAYEAQQARIGKMLQIGNDAVKACGMLLDRFVGENDLQKTRDEVAIAIKELKALEE